jgi:hypothetical protein
MTNSGKYRVLYLNRHVKSFRTRDEAMAWIVGRTHDDGKPDQFGDYEVLDASDGEV